ncbi:MAG: glycosyltransferase [Myxococcales bacterium]|nr:glycosyltransferase [Myxococcales bacterium]MCB9520379.1 glycosyltransferase [Myxococcales bacterium]
MQLSVVVPLFNESEHVDELVDRLVATGRSLGLPFEVLLVDDGSADDTCAKVERRTEPEVRLVRMPRNSGQFMAVKRGLSESRGALVAMLDGDLQDPPELIAEMVRVAQAEERDPVAVYAVKSSRSESLTFQLAQGVFHGLQAALAVTPIPFGASSYCLLSGRLAHRVGALPLRWGNVAAVVAGLGVHGTIVTYDKAARTSGSSRLGLGGHLREAAWSLAITGAAGRLGAAVAVAGFLTGVALWRTRRRGATAVALSAGLVGAVALAGGRVVRRRFGARAAG